MRFFKYQGIGNDFIILDRLNGGEPPAPELAKTWCDRSFGIGADGVLTILPASGQDSAIARMHVTNSDGSIPEMCGNGLRCVVRYLVDERGYKDSFSVETGKGPLACTAHRDGQNIVSEIEIDMGKPELEASLVPMTVSGKFISQQLDVAGRIFRGTAVSMGNPHIVLFDVPLEETAALGPAIEHHTMFPARTNVEFARVEGNGLVVIVWERGCGFTKACGTGACASMVAAVLEGRLSAGEERPVKLPGGLLKIRVEPDLSRVFLKGPAIKVFEGEIVA